MKGIQFINNSKGERVKVVVDLNRYGKEFAVFLNELSKKYAPKTTNSSSMFSDNANSSAGDRKEHISSNSGANARGMKIEKLLQTGRSYVGTPYRTGGTTRSGMDCSGFTMVAFQSIGVNLPRISRQQATVGQGLRKDQIQKGDLVYFATGTPGRVNHVGLVSSVSGGVMKFLHASSSRGIMEASTSLSYWQKAFMGARRVV